MGVRIQSGRQNSHDYHMIIVTFTESSVLKVFTIHTSTQSRIVRMGPHLARTKGESTKHGPPVHGPPPWTWSMDRVHQNMDRVHGPPIMDRVHGPPIFTSAKNGSNQRLGVLSAPVM